jgi:hypothetical protein
MTGGLAFARLVALAIGLTMFVAGLAVLAVGGAAAFATGLWLVGIGAAFMIGAVIERIRYRSDALDRSGPPTGPAGGEPRGTRLDARFRRSEEVFTDPTTGQRMRVWIDPSSGERRYVAED